MTTDLRVVFDTNVHVSSALFPGSVPRRAIDLVMRDGRVIASPDMLAELKTVLDRPKFDRYAPAEVRLETVAVLVATAEIVVPTTIVQACRDPDDDKLLELAVDGNATHLVTGDLDLLVLHPFQNIPILTPADFLAAVAPP